MFAEDLPTVSFILLRAPSSAEVKRYKSDDEKASTQYLIDVNTRAKLFGMHAAGSNASCWEFEP